MIKQRLESIESFKKGNRQDLVDKEEKELLVLREFVPVQLSADEIAGDIEEAVAQLEARSPRTWER